jgi:L-fuculose-phosphate aldolase
MLEQERDQLAAACRRLAEAGLVVGTAGNLSLRAGDRLAVTASGATLSRLEPDDVVVVGLDGVQLAGRGRPSSELELHLTIYRRYGAGAVVHTHGPMATALSCVIDELPPVHYAMLALGGSVRVAPYATYGTPELARATADALQGRAAALMANHGAVTCGEDLESALQATLLLEWACQVYWHAAALGAPRTLTSAQLDAVAEQSARLAAERDTHEVSGRNPAAPRAQEPVST